MKMPMPDDWDGLSFCRWAVCWPESSKWRAILHGLIETPTQGRFWDFDTGNFEDLRNSFLPAYEYNYELLEVIMACDDAGLLAIAESLDNIAESLALGVSGGCACGCGSTTVNCGTAGTGGGASPPTTNTGDVGEGAEPPPGFDTIEEYRAYKCAVATYIVATYKDDLSRLGTISSTISWVANRLAVVCAGLLLTPIPGDELFALAALLVSTIAADVWADTLALMQDAINGAEEDLVCALYNAQDVGSAVSSFVEVMGAAIDGLGTLPYTYAAKQFISPFTTTDNLNRLFVNEEGLTLPAGDCSGCGEEELPILQVRDVNGGWVDSDLGWNVEVTFTPIQEGNGYYYAQIRIKPPAGQTTGVYQFDVVSANHLNNGGCPDNWSGPGVYQNIELQEGTNTGWQFGCNSNSTSFTGTFGVVT